MAWLMLVIASLGASPVGTGDMHGDAKQDVPAAAAGLSRYPTHADHSHASSHECCDQATADSGTAGEQACACIGVCAGPVPPAPGGVVMASLLPSRYAQPLRQHAPSAPTSPPLRPPPA